MPKAAVQDSVGMRLRGLLGRIMQVNDDLVDAACEVVEAAEAQDGTTNQALEARLDRLERLLG